MKKSSLLVAALLAFTTSLFAKEEVRFLISSLKEEVKEVQLQQTDSLSSISSVVDLHEKDLELEGHCCADVLVGGCCAVVDNMVLINTDGQVVAFASSNKINVSGLEKGSYMLKAISGNQKFEEQVFIK